MRPSRALLFGLSALGLACRVEERVDPAPRSAPSTGATSASSTGGTGGGDAVVRTVTTKSPWGGPAQNLLADGDFELSISFDGHEGANAWYAFDTAKDTTKYLRGETGGLCRTGLRCAVLEANTALFGRGTGGPGGAGVDVSVWAKLPIGKACDVLTVSLLDCDQAIFAVKVKPVSLLPGEDGWCGYEASVAKAATKRCLYVDSKLAPGESALLDSAAVVAKPAPMMAEVHEPLPAEAQSRARRLARRVRDLTPLGGRERRDAPALP